MPPSDEGEMTDEPLSPRSVGRGVARISALPASLPPRGLSRVQAAEYIGVGATKFDEMVADGRMPLPIRIDSRTVWDRHKIDEAFVMLGDRAVSENPWDRL